MLPCKELRFLIFLSYASASLSPRVEHDHFELSDVPAHTPAPAYHDSLYDNPAVVEILARERNSDYARTEKNVITGKGKRTDSCSEALEKGGIVPLVCVLERLVPSQNNIVMLLNQKDNEELLADYIELDSVENQALKDDSDDPVMILLHKFLQKPERKFSYDNADPDFRMKNQSGVGGEAVIAIKKEPKAVVKIESKDLPFNDADKKNLQSLVDFLAGYVKNMLEESANDKKTRKYSANIWGNDQWVTWPEGVEASGKQYTRNGETRARERKRAHKRMSKDVNLKELSSESDSDEKVEKVEKSEEVESDERVEKAVKKVIKNKKAKKAVSAKTEDSKSAEAKPKKIRGQMKRATKKKRKPKRFAVVEDKDSNSEEKASSEEKSERSASESEEKSDEESPELKQTSDDDSTEASVPLSEEITTKKPVKSKPRIQGRPDVIMQSSGRVYKEGRDFRKSSVLKQLLDLRRRLPQFMPKRYHWDVREFHKLGYFWFNGPQGKVPPGTWRVVY